MTQPIALTMGEPAGIGGEIALMAWLRRSQGVPPFFVIDDPDRLARLAAMLGWTVPLRAVAGPEEAAGCFHEALGVLPRRLAHPVLMGRPDAANARAVIAAIVSAVDLAGNAAKKVQHVSVTLRYIALGAKRVVVPAGGRLRIGVSTDAKRYRWTLGARSGKGSGRVLKLHAPTSRGTYRLTVSERGHVGTASVVVR